MKKWFLVLLAAVLLLVSSACRASTQGRGGPGIDAPEKGQLVTPEKGRPVPPEEYGVQYIRTNGYREGAGFPQAVIIRSTEELDGYYRANRDTFDLEREENVSSDSTIGFLDACDKYDATYFEKGYLVLVLLEEGSGSVRHKVTEVSANDGGELTVQIDTISPEIGTCDMAEWHIILEMSNNTYVKDESAVRVFLDGRLAYDQGTVISPVTGTQSPVVFREPPEGKVLHGYGSTPLLKAGCTWFCPNGDGTTTCVNADHAHPLFCKDILDPIHVSGDYVKLAFEDTPDSIEVRCWPDTAWNSSTVPGEAVSVYGTTFDLKRGGYIYEITAAWNENQSKHFGSASYFIYIVSNGEAS